MGSRSGGREGGRRHERTADDFVAKRRGDTKINAVIGAAASMVLPFPGAGGALAGYLQDEGRTAGAKVGALSGILLGIVTIIPLFLFFLLFGGIAFLGAAGSGDAGAGVASILFTLMFAVIPGLFIAVTMAAFNAAGGFVGGMINEDDQGSFDEYGGRRDDFEGTAQHDRGRGDRYDEPRDDRYDDRGRGDADREYEDSYEGGYGDTGGDAGGE